MAKAIWLVQGNTGSYEDYREWVVCAYKDQLLAEHHAKLANEKAKAFPKLWADRKRGTGVWESDGYKAFMGDLDPRAHWDDQTEYTCYSVDVNPGVPLHARLGSNECSTFNCKLERGHEDSCATNGD